MSRSGLFSILSLLSLVALWAIAAAWSQSSYLPTPIKVFEIFRLELSNGSLLFHIGATFGRVLIAFAFAFIFGTAIGFALGRNRQADLFFDAWLIFALNVPALVTIVFCYLYLGIGETAAILAVALNKIPTFAITMREGARALDPAIDEVAKLYRYTGFRKYRLFIWPQLAPYFAAAIRNGLALIWKIVLIVELIGRGNGVGFQINLYFSQFDIAHILVYTLSFMAVIWLIESLIIKPWEIRARAWRGEHA